MKSKISILIIALVALIAIAPFVFAEEGGVPAMPGADGPGGEGGESVSADLSAVLEVAGKTLSESGKTYKAAEEDLSCVLVKDGGELNLDGATLDKTGDSSNTQSSDFSGLNSAAVAQNGTLNIKGSGFWLFGSSSKITTNAEGANGLFATGTNAVIEADNLEISTEKNSARGIDATYGGTIHAINLKITTLGEHCAAVATDRGEGFITIEDSVLNTEGKGSPCIYSTGNISAKDCSGKAGGSSAAVIEGKNLINLEDCDFTCAAYGRTETGIDAVAVMIYQSMSGDSSVGTGTFISKDSKITVDSGSKAYKTAPAFFVTNTKAIIDLTSTELEYGSDILLNASGNDGEWGNSGSNGGDVVFNLTKEDLSGKIIVDAISSLELNIKSSTLTTAINSEHSNGTITISLSGDSTLKLTGDCYISSISDEKEDFSNIESNGFNIYYDSSKCPSLNGKTINLNGGGKLIPI